MTYLLVVFIVSTAGAMVGWRTGGARWCVAGGTAVGLVAGLLRATRPMLFLAENGLVFSFLAYGVPPMLVGLCAGLATRTVTRRILE